SSASATSRARAARVRWEIARASSPPDATMRPPAHRGHARSAVAPATAATATSPPAAAIPPRRLRHLDGHDDSTARASVPNQATGCAAFGGSPNAASSPTADASTSARLIPLLDLVRVEQLCEVLDARHDARPR